MRLTRRVEQELAVIVELRGAIAVVLMSWIVVPAPRWILKVT
jgi:hypothetical protein